MPGITGYGSNISKSPAQTLVAEIGATAADVSTKDLLCIVSFICFTPT